MRLIRHLNEITRTKPNIDAKMEDVQYWMAFIEKECGQIIKEYKTANAFFYRGSTGPSFVEKSGRDKKVRPPKDTPIEVHRYLNKLYLKKFGWKVRDGVSVTADLRTAETYGGTTFIFFPVDGYAYAWSRKVADLYNWLPLETKKHHQERLKTKALRQAAILQYEERFQALIDLYSRSGIQHALKHDSEVMFRTKKWFGIDERYQWHIQEYLGMN